MRGRGFSERSPSLALPPEEEDGWGYAREAASLREAPPSRSLPKSSWRLGWLILLARFRLKVGRGFLLVGCGHGG